MNTYLTEVNCEINGKIYCGPDVEANSWEDAEEKVRKEYPKEFIRIVGEKVGEVEA